MPNLFLLFWIRHFVHLEDWSVNCPYCLLFVWLQIFKSLNPKKKKKEQNVHSCHKREKKNYKTTNVTLTFNTVTYLVLHLKRWARSEESRPMRCDCGHFLLVFSFLTLLPVTGCTGQHCNVNSVERLGNSRTST